MDRGENLIDQLRAEREMLQNVIASLERLQAKIDAGREFPDGRRRPGRKSMAATERKQVSERMKRYWAEKRKREEEAGRGKRGPSGTA
jgi:hypothetical protein